MVIGTKLFRDIKRNALIKINPPLQFINPKCLSRNYMAFFSQQNKNHTYFFNLNNFEFDYISNSDFTKFKQDDWGSLKENGQFEIILKDYSICNFSLLH